MQPLWPPHCSDEKLVSNEIDTGQRRIYVCPIEPFKSMIILAATLG